MRDPSPPPAPPRPAEPTHESGYIPEAETRIGRWLEERRERRRRRVELDSTFDVRRLRRAASRLTGWKWTGDDPLELPALLRDAAIEIERLRARVAADPIRVGPDDALVLVLSGDIPEEGAAGIADELERIGLADRSLVLTADDALAFAAARQDAAMFGTGFIRLERIPPDAVRVNRTDPA